MGGKRHDRRVRPLPAVASVQPVHSSGMPLPRTQWVPSTASKCILPTAEEITCAKDLEQGISDL